MADIFLSPTRNGAGVFATAANLTGAALLTSPGVTGDWVKWIDGYVIDGIATSYTEGGAGMTSATVTFEVLIGTDTTTAYELCNIVGTEPVAFTITLTTTAKNKYIPLAVASPTTGIAPWLSGCIGIRAIVTSAVTGATTDNVTVTVLGRRRYTGA